MTPSIHLREKRPALRWIRPLLLIGGGLVTLMVCLVVRFSSGTQRAVAETRTVPNEKVAASDPQATGLQRRLWQTSMVSRYFAINLRGSA